ncbi:unnamed protein product [Adineta ricciae]|nr:unnamed protein product [Adineta ricciae]
MIEIEILNSDKEDIDFVKSKYEFIIKMETPLKKGANLGKVKTSQRRKTIFFQIDNEVIENDIKINEETGELTLLNEEILFNKTLISFSIKLFDSIKQKYLLRKTTIVFIYFRFQNQLKSISFSYFNQSSLIQRQNENHFLISSKNSIPSNEILFSIEILPSYYLFDQYFLYLDNTQTQFSLIFQRKNVYSLKLLQPSFSNNLFLQFSIEHQLTKELLSSQLIIQFQFVSNQENLCQENLFYELFDLSTEKSIGKLQVLKTTNETISSFSTFQISDENPNEIVIDQCQMNFTQLNSSLFLTQFRLCSSSSFSPSCFSIEKNISSSNDLLRLKERNSSIMKIVLSLTPIEIIFLSFGCVFILSIIMILTIICRLKGRRVCLEIKNYLFYGKKYGLSHAQSLSNAKMNQRVHSIVIRESHSPSIESIKEKIHTDGVSREESNSQQLNISNDSKSISDRILQETDQLFDLLVSNENLHLPRLASEV